MDWDLTNFIIATWGAVLATTLGVLEVMRQLERRRGKIRVIVRDFFGRDSDGQPTLGEWVCFEAVNDAEKPVMIMGLVLAVGKHEIDLTPYSGTPNLTVISEGEDFDRLIERGQLLAVIGEKTQQRPPYRCAAIFHSRAGRRYRKRFTLDAQGVHA